MWGMNMPVCRACQNKLTACADVSLDVLGQPVCTCGECSEPLLARHGPGVVFFVCDTLKGGGCGADFKNRLKKKIEKNICHGGVSGRTICGAILVKSGQGRPGNIM